MTEESKGQHYWAPALYSEAYCSDKRLLAIAFGLEGIEHVRLRTD